MIFFSNTSLQYKLYDSYSTCITNFKSIISLLYILNNIYLHQVRLLQFMRGRLRTQHRHNAGTSVTFRSSGSLPKRKKEGNADFEWANYNF